MLRAISIGLLRLLGWRIELQYDRLPPKYVMIVLPHTSNWDFPIGILARTALGIDVKYLGKASLFRKPYGWFFRWLGGYPIDRSRRHGYVQTAVKLFREREAFALCIAPEGTRRKVERLRTGFYYIALGAEVPILMAQLDWQHKQIVISPPFYPSGEETADFEQINAFYEGVLGKIPACSYGYNFVETP